MGPAIKVASLNEGKAGNTYEARLRGAAARKSFTLFVR